MGFLGFANVYAMRVNLSVAVVAMVNATATKTVTNHSDVCPMPPVTNSTVPPVSRSFVILLYPTPPAHKTTPKEKLFVKF